VRSLGIEDFPESVESLLLLEQVVRSRSRRFGLERAVHALVCAVLLRVPRVDPMVSDPEPLPPDGQSRQAKQARRCERCAVVRQNSDRESVLAEDELHTRLRAFRANSAQALAAKHVARMLVRQRERIAHAPIAELELALVVATPK